jgi:hypothetical protein
VKLFSGDPRFALLSLLLIDEYASYRLRRALMVTTSDNHGRADYKPSHKLLSKTRGSEMEKAFRGNRECR